MQQLPTANLKRHQELVRDFAGLWCCSPDRSKLDNFSDPFRNFPFVHCSNCRDSLVSQYHLKGVVVNKS